MSQIITNLDTGIKMPPIDISAPREIETLTCAMDVFWGRTAGLVNVRIIRYLIKCFLGFLSTLDSKR